MYSEQFAEFYQEYLGIKDKISYGEIQICKCKYRDIPLNKKYFYKIIATIYNREKIISCSPEFNETEIKFLCNNIKFETIGNSNGYNYLEFPGFELSYMNRMLLNSKIDINEIELSRCNVVYRNLETYRKYVALINDNLIGYCKISDVICGFGNLVVWVDISKRRLGIGENLVRLMVNKCYEKGIVPMYIVKLENTASSALATKVGFHVIQRELVVSYKK